MRKFIPILILAVILSFGFITVKPDSKGIVQEFRYTRIAKVDANGDAALDINNLTWSDINSSAAHWVAKPSGWTWVQFQFYAHGKDGNDPNSGQFDVNCISSNTYGGGKILFHSTVLIGNEQLSHDPNSGVAFRTGQISDPNNKWANADANFVESADTTIGRSGYSGTTSTGGVLRYSVEAFDNTYGINIRNVSPAAKIDYIYCIMTGGVK